MKGSSPLMTSSLDEAESLSREHAEESRISDYARDLLTLDPARVQQVRVGIEAVRHPDPTDPRFDHVNQEESVD